MTMSPGSISSASLSTVPWTNPAGTMIQATRGFSSRATKSSSEVAPTAPSPASCSTMPASTSKTTTSCPSRVRRRERLAPIRPSPIIPSCMCVLPLDVPEVAVAPDERVRRRVVSELRLGLGGELGDDARREHLAELDTPLVERVDVPDRALRKDRMLVESDELAKRLGRQALGQDDVRGPVALEDAVRHEPLGRALRPHLVRRLPEGERLGLR